MSEEAPTDAEVFEQLMQERIAYFRGLSQTALSTAASATKPNRKAAHMGLSVSYDELARITDLVRAQVVAQMRINQSLLDSLLNAWGEIDQITTKLASLDNQRMKNLAGTHEDLAKLQTELAKELTDIVHGPAAVSEKAAPTPSRPARTPR